MWSALIFRLFEEEGYLLLVLEKFPLVWANTTSFAVAAQGVGSFFDAQALWVRAAAAACGCLHKMPQLFPGMPSSSEAQEAPLIWAASLGCHFLHRPHVTTCAAAPGGRTAHFRPLYVLGSVAAARQGEGGAERLSHHSVVVFLCGFIVSKGIFVRCTSFPRSFAPSSAFEGCEANELCFCERRRISRASRARVREWRLCSSPFAGQVMHHKVF